MLRRLRLWGEVLLGLALVVISALAALWRSRARSAETRGRISEEMKHVEEAKAKGDTATLRNELKEEIGRIRAPRSQGGFRR